MAASSFMAPDEGFLDTGQYGSSTACREECLRVAQRGKRELALQKTECSLTHFCYVSSHFVTLTSQKMVAQPSSIGLCATQANVALATDSLPNTTLLTHYEYLSTG